MNLHERASKVLMNTYGFLPPVFKKGEGATLYDDNGKEYIDFTSGIGVNSLGYGNKNWCEAIYNQSLNFAHLSNIFVHENEVILAEELTKLTSMSKVFFSNSGAEANEGAIKLARKYSFDKYGKNRNTIITLKQSFHGRTMLTLKATGQEKFHNYFFPFPEGFKYVEANNIDDLKSNLSSDVCAIMMERIQGEGGVLPITKEFAKSVEKICKDNDILLIMDEVQCGIGRCGSFLGYMNLDISPDIVTLAKGLGGGLPIGAFMCNEKLKDVLTPSTHGSTFGGNPVCTAGALEVLKVVANDVFLNTVKAKGDMIQKLLKEANNPHIKDVRGEGLMIGIETDENIGEIQKKLLEKGLLVLTAGKNVIRLLPPLIISEKEISKGMKILLDNF